MACCLHQFTEMARFLVVVPFCTLVVGGCSSISVETDKAPMVDFRYYRTYGWTQGRGPASSEPPKASTAADERIRAALEQELAQRNMRSAPRGRRPDFLIDYSAASDLQRVADPGLRSGPGMIVGPIPAPVGTTYVEGTLVVDFIDAKTNRVFWRGVGRGAINGAGGNLDMIDSAVKEMIAEYP